MVNLSVNINKIATLRNARGSDLPNLVQFAKDCETFGANGITIHPRPDERHITKKDVYDLAPIVQTEFNIEGYPDDRFMSLIREVRPKQATLVPDAPGVLTSDNGWDIAKNEELLTKTIEELRSLGVRSSIFVNADKESMDLARMINTDAIEFYTGPYAQDFDKDRELAVEKYVYAAEIANTLGLRINAGHDLNLENLAFFKNNVKYLSEVSIGHAIVSDALYIGIEKAIHAYKECLS
ncbi:MAG: pyridoxine 5'-phosphate synthase [Cryomorphaceae bacterium]|nr:pyridoxine 5'-phosphate synthase [Cryomorphaceae bacterium]|tara:strand:+ start:6913 stop:7626 length:714 start_codon:yes stop_codon:yes gene_type:complete